MGLRKKQSTSRNIKSLRSDSRCPICGQALVTDDEIKAKLCRKDRFGGQKTL